MLSTFCILMHRRATQDEAFDESITQYGYEDTLFGLRLKERGLTIKHTDTPCLHTGIDTSEQFLRKTQTALSTLRSLGPVGPRISGIARLSQRLGPLRPLVACAAKPLIPLLRRHLLSARPTVCAFRAYQLL